MRKKLLITGFEPFGKDTVNSSWEAVSRLEDRIGDYELTKLLLPTVFGKAAERVLAEAETLCPDVILCIGQAGGAKRGNAGNGGHQSSQCFHRRQCGK